MKAIFILCLASSLCGVTLLAQDAATEERLNKISGQIEDLIASQKALQKHIAELTRELENVRESASKPNASYATQDDLRRLAEAVKEVDRKRLSDGERIQTELKQLGKVIETTLSSTPKKKPAATTASDTTEKPEKSSNEKVADKGIEYVIKERDTLSGIVKSCRDQKINVTMDQILKANPGLKAEKMRPGQKIFIPALPQS